MTFLTTRVFGPDDLVKKGWSLVNKSRIVHHQQSTHLEGEGIRMSFEKLQRCIVGLQIELFRLIELLPLAAKSAQLGEDTHFGHYGTLILHILGQVSQSNL